MNKYSEDAIRMAIPVSATVCLVVESSFAKDANSAAEKTMGSRADGSSFE